MNCIGQDSTNLYNLKWNLPNTSPSSFEVDSISPEQIVFHQDLHSHSSLWNVEYTQGIQLIVFDPDTKSNNGDYICSGIIDNNYGFEARNSSLMAQTHISILNGKLFS